MTTLHDRLHELFEYQADGRLTRLAPYKNLTAGSAIGTTTSSGYLRAGVDGSRYFVHRLVWCYHYSELPPDDIQVDHINGLKQDNRIENLRLATRSQNMQNISYKSYGKSGLVGVHQPVPGKKWAARIMINKKSKHLGRFDTPEEAHAAYLEAKKHMHTFTLREHYTTTGGKDG